MEEEVKIEENKNYEYQDPFEDLPPTFTNLKNVNKKLRRKNEPPPPLTDSDNTDTDTESDKDSRKEIDISWVNDRIKEIDITQLTEKEFSLFINEDNDKVTWTFIETNETIDTELELKERNSNFQHKFLCEVSPTHFPVEYLEEEKKD